MTAAARPTVRVICTDKGTHKVNQMLTFELTAMVSPSGERQPEQWREVNRRRPLQASYAFACRRCGRNTQMTATTLRDALDKFADTGLPELDVSLLPY